MYRSVVLEVLVASPADTPDERVAVRETVTEWNLTNASMQGVVLIPRMWETDTYPDLAMPAQAAINKQIGDRCDILVAVFWTRLGTPTTAALSGTVEEIERFAEAGKPVLVYFSDAPVHPSTVDSEEIERVRAYRDELKARGLFGSFSLVDELRAKLRDDLTRRIISLRNEGAIVVTDEGPAAGPEGEVNEALPDRPSEGQNLQPIRGWLAGWLAMWDAKARFEEDPPIVDLRFELAREVGNIVLQGLRDAATACPQAPVLPRLSDLTSKAAGVSTMRVYIDGGRSFNALTDGCRQLLADLHGIVDDPAGWSCGPENGG